MSGKEESGESEGGETAQSFVLNGCEPLAALDDPMLCFRDIGR